MSTYQIRYYNYPRGSASRPASSNSASRLAKRRLASKEFGSESISYPSDEEFHKAYRVYHRLAQLPLRINTSHLLSVNRRTRTVTVQYAKIQLRPLSLRAETERLSVVTLEHLKAILRAYVELLYNNGIAYNVTDRGVFLTRVPLGQNMRVLTTLRAPKNSEWALYLGGTAHLEYRSQAEREGCPTWMQMLETQLDKVEKLFTTLEEKALNRELRELDLQKKGDCEVAKGD